VIAAINTMQSSKLSLRKERACGESPCGMMLLSFVPAIAVKIRSRKLAAAFGTPQLTAQVATTDEEFVDFGIGVAVACLLTLTAWARADQDEIGKVFGGGALADRFAQFGKNVRRHLRKDLHHGGRFLGAGR